MKINQTMAQIVEAPPRMIYIFEGDLERIVSQAVEKALSEGHTARQKATASKKVFGISGIAEALGCSRSTAHRIKESGALDGAISQVGKIISGYEDKIIEAGAAYFKSQREKKQKSIKQPRMIRR